MNTVDTTDPARLALGAGRVAVGLNAWMFPRLLWRVFGMGDIGGDSRARYVTRLFGVRDVALGGAVLIAEDDVALRRAVDLGIAVDCIDVAAAVLSMRRGGRIRGALFAGAGAAVFAGLGLWIRQRLVNAPPPVVFVDEVVEVVEATD
jgi:hypothetical protein